MRAGRSVSQAARTPELQRTESFDEIRRPAYNHEDGCRAHVPQFRGPTIGGDTASTGVKTRGMHAELH